MTKVDQSDGEQVDAIVAQIATILAHKPMELQSAALADLVAIWLAGMQGEAKHKWRIEALEMFVELVMRLVPVNEAKLIGDDDPPLH